MGASPRAGDLVALALMLVLFAHDRPARWRTRSLKISGTLLAAALAWCLLLLAPDAWTAWASRPWPLLVGPLAGLLWSLLIDRIGTRRPLALEGAGRARHLAPAALAGTPGLGWRIARPGETAENRVLVPRLPFGDRSVMLPTPSGPVPLHPEGPEEGMGRAVKRTSDLIGAAALLLLTLPVTLALALAARLSSPGPAFHVQTRVTLGGRTFRIHKIRSMTADAEPGGKPVWPAENDARITPFGRFLRRFWLDELPQLADVIRGPMSLVGPRPERPSFAQAFSDQWPNYLLRHQVRAGITGLAQVKGLTGNTSLTRRLHLDLRYVSTWSPRQDLLLLIGTVAKAVRRPPILPG